MNKTKKTLLSIGSILTIVSSSFAIFCAIFSFFIATMLNENLFKEIYMEDTNLTYYEEIDGSYYFTSLINGKEEEFIDEEEIEMISEIATDLVNFIGFYILALATAKIVLSIRILILNKRNEYSSGCSMALVILSILTTNFIEAILLIVAICFKDKIIKSDNKPLGLNDIPIDYFDKK